MWPLRIDAEWKLTYFLNHLPSSEGERRPSVMSHVAWSHPGFPVTILVSVHTRSSCVLVPHVCVRSSR